MNSEVFGIDVGERDEGWKEGFDLSYVVHLERSAEKGSSASISRTGAKERKVAYRLRRFSTLPLSTSKVVAILFRVEQNV